jgi:N-dimethylarginine dimethylaminohydrolase
MNYINSYTEFQPLKEVVVGRGYPADYFDCVDDPQSKRLLQQIFTEIEEDFQYLIKTLESFGITVVRPPIISKELFERTIQHVAIMPPLTPRDRQTVFGNKLVQVALNYSFTPLVEYYKKLYPDDVVVPQGKDLQIMQDGNASCVFRMGRDIWFDESEWLRPEQSQWLIDNVLTDPNYRFHRMKTDGHSDCVFAVLKPGVILTSFHDAGVAYAQDFPGWNLHRVQNPSLHEFNNFRTEFHPGQKWWVPGLNNLDQFRNYVDQYLNHWVGEIHETVFDVNCLIIDTEHVVFACYNKDVFDYCERNGITPILCELRHRFFFDGGTHCCTLDIRREGGMEDYFG